MFWILILTTAINCAGTVALKIASGTGSIATTAIGLAAYMVGGLLYMSVLAHQGLGLASLMTSLLQLLAMLAIGLTVFRDPPLSLTQWLGVGCALLALLLIAGSRL